MSIDEIKSELDLRNVNYDDCTNKSSLVQRLVESRTLGKADPSIVDKFVAADMEEAINKIDNSEVDDSDWISNITSKDGALPGGMTPQMVKQLTSDRELMTMLREPKMQDILKSVMTNGPGEM